MRRIGLSIYPDLSNYEDDQRYLEAGHKLGYTRVFTSLLQLSGDAESGTLAKFKRTIKCANDLGYQVIVDINPGLFKDLGVTYDDLHFFADLGVWGLRLDEGFTGLEEARMTRNPYGLKIEINMSAGTNYLASILSYHPLRDNLLGCHNFYPQEYTGLSERYFMQYSQPYRDANLHTAAFVSSHVAQTGPWPVHEGLPTMEADRDLPIGTQVQHLLLTGMIDDVIIGNAYASNRELELVAQNFFSSQPLLGVRLRSDVTAVERAIVLDGVNGVHLYRGDASEYMLRSTQTRITHSGDAIPARPSTGDFQRGDVLVVNDDYARYKGEMQIALRSFRNDGRRNVVGHIVDSDAGLLQYIKPWQTFKLIEQ
ncbi:DUF871 domain-containing protein [Lacticaseibacillus zhaodongensis]|uniref:DUF871 domain-containing protein n=1 Tax=Lacticaseibacillus zhaodongensis TaxID=2668065 RepID=UPI0012D2C609|nr:MupG family TIM beta-alpha barrel fold protein [Lacticaseibacillus zhaodongensis]